MKCVVLSVVFVMTSILFVHSQNYIEKVYLKNGSVIRGIVVEQVPETSLEVQTSDGSVYVFEMSEVEKVSKEISEEFDDKADAHDEMLESTLKRRQSRYRAIFEFGDVYRTFNFRNWVISISTSYGKQFSPYVFVGFGVGVDYYKDWESAAVPVFLDARFYIIDSDVTPYFGVKAGYSMSYIMGFYSNPTFGIYWWGKKQVGVNISLGYNLQMVDLRTYYYAYSLLNHDVNSESIGGISLKLGIIF